MTTLSVLIVIAATYPSGVKENTEMLESIKLAWESLSSFEIEVEEGSLKNHERGKPLRISMQYRADREWETQIAGNVNNGEKLLQYFAQDERFTYIASFKNSGQMYQLNIKSLEKPKNSYELFKSIISMIITPGGITIPENITNATSIDFNSAKQDHPTVKFKVPFRYDVLTCTLDGKHDWWPSRVELSSSSIIYNVSKFTRENGRWFPTEGFQELAKPDLSAKESSQRWFKVRTLSINKPILKKSFGRIDPQVGTMVENNATKNYFIYGQSKPRPAHNLSDRAMLPSKDTIISESPRSNAHWIILGVVSSITLVCAIAYYVCRR